MKHISLFSGIGGFDLAAEWMGWENVAHCEWNPFGQKVLKYYWPNAISYHDITKTDFTIHRGTIDIITGGFPCQPFSSAGKRKGKDDDRYLWPEMLRVINEVNPTWVIGENVAGLVSMVQPEIIETYLENQTALQDQDNQETITELQEYVTETVCKDLEQIGYSVQPFVIPACSTGAPHRRDRIWFVAFRNDTANTNSETVLRGTGENERQSKSQRLQERDEIQQPDKSNGLQDAWNTNGTKQTEKQKVHRSKQSTDTNRDCNVNATNSNSGGLERTIEVGRHGIDAERESELGIIANTDSAMRERRPSGGQAKKRSEPAKEQFRGCDKFYRTDWSKFPTQSPLCDGNDGVSARLDGITFPKWRNESIKAGGNAIVPQIAFQIFKAINEYEKL